jgi:hypothetical protein
MWPAPNGKHIRSEQLFFAEMVGRLNSSSCLLNLFSFFLLVIFTPETLSKKKMKQYLGGIELWSLGCATATLTTRLSPRRHT